MLLSRAGFRQQQDADIGHRDPCVCKCALNGLGPKVDYVKAGVLAEFVA